MSGGLGLLACAMGMGPMGMPGLPGLPGEMQGKGLGPMGQVQGVLGFELFTRHWSHG
jgi:hypothetical protein